MILLHEEMRFNFEKKNEAFAFDPMIRQKVPVQRAEHLKTVMWQPDNLQYHNHKKYDK